MLPINRCYIYLIILFTQILPVKAQICQPDNFVVQFQGNAAYSNIKAIQNGEGDIISVGNVLQVDGGKFADAWMYKITDRGRLLWGKRYMLGGYNSGYFESICQASDSNYFVSGRFSLIKQRTTDWQYELIYASTLLLKFNKFGNLLWMKPYTKYSTRSPSINNLTPLSDGTLIGTVSVDGIDFRRRMLFHMNANGTIRWTINISSDSLDINSFRLKLLNSNHLLVTGNAAGKTMGVPNLKKGLYAASINIANGTINWSKFYFAALPDNIPYTFSHVQQITSGSNGAIYLYSSISDGPQIIAPPFTHKALLLKLSAGGNLIKAITLEGDQPGLSVVDAQLSGNKHVILLHNRTASLLTELDDNNNILWSTGYGKIDGNLSASKLFLKENNISLYFSGRNQVAMSALVQTEKHGSIECIQTPTIISTANITNAFIVENNIINTNIEETDLFSNLNTGINHFNYTLHSTTSCTSICCSDIQSDTTKINLCNRNTYTLPDNNIINESGTYFLKLKTTAGCDSIAYYNVDLARKPEISLGDDECLKGKDTIFLKVAAGYDRYVWSHSNQNDSIAFTTQTGIYWVDVYNRCGVTRDSIEIFTECDADVYMPTAFTPNGDGLNDVFRYPSLNKNKLYRLAIYNRWGQKIFETRDATAGWSGKYKGLTQPHDTYIYILEVKTLDGKKKVQKGTVTLVQ